MEETTYSSKTLDHLGLIAGLMREIGVREVTDSCYGEQSPDQIARRSFATNFFLNGIPAAILMQITGHSTEKQFMQYINVDPKANAARFAELAKGLM
jgi:hypothetical protein